MIDDNPRNNSIFINLLKNDYKVDVAMYLISATRLLKSNNYSLIIIDVMMPTQNLNCTQEMQSGYAYYDEVIRQRLQLKTPILFWSRLYEDSFTNFFGDNPAQNLHFEHKDSEVNNILDKIRNILP